MLATGFVSLALIPDEGEIHCFILALVVTLPFTICQFSCFVIMRKMLGLASLVVLFAGLGLG